jgi:hypothetical protein
MPAYHPLTKPQKAIWNMERFYGGSVANITGSVFFNAPVSVSRLQDALNHMILKHDSMRIRLGLRYGDAAQYVDGYTPAEFRKVGFTDKAEFERWVNALAREPFDLTGQLYKIYIVSIGKRTGYVLHLHHITADAWTVSLLVKAVDEYLFNEAGPCPVYSYMDYAESEREYEGTAQYQRDKAWFLSRFEQCMEPAYLSDKQAESPSSASYSNFSISSMAASTLSML